MALEHEVGSANMDAGIRGKILTLLKQNKLHDAKALLIENCDLHPKDIELWLFLASINRNLNLYQEVIDNYKQVISINPEHAGAYSCIGNAYSNMGRYNEAIKQYNKALKQSPNDAGALNNLGNVLFVTGHIEDAITNFQQSLKHRPNYALAYYNLGNALFEKGDADRAENNYLHAIKYSPDSIGARVQLGNLLRLRGKLDGSLSQLLEAIKLNSNSIEANASIGLTLLERGNLEQAIHYLKKTVDLKPESENHYLSLARAQRMQGRFKDALNSYKKCQEFSPENIAAISGQADIFQRVGELDKSYKLIRPLIDSHRSDIRAAIVYTRLCDYFGDRVEAERLLLSLMEKDDANPQNIIVGNYALGHLFDKSKNYEQAFKCFKSANKLTLYPYECATHQAHVDKLIAAFNPDVFHKTPSSTIDTELPIFIVGMPRSGTSLVEQILASHPSVFGAGELNDMNDQIFMLDQLPEIYSHYPDCLKNMTNIVVNKMSKQFIDRLRRFSINADRITDKMPSNFIHLGLIAILFPKAHVIHCTRNPLDTCLSIYFQSFSGAHPYATDLANISDYYLQYVKLMEHWKRVLPINILDVKYEDLVGDIKPVSKQLIDYCGLEWDERCLSFHKTSRTIATASYDQVRKPLYKESVGRWRNYNHFIGPLKSALGTRMK